MRLSAQFLLDVLAGPHLPTLFNPVVISPVFDLDVGGQKELPNGTREKRLHRGG